MVKNNKITVFFGKIFVLFMCLGFTSEVKVLRSNSSSIEVVSNKGEGFILKVSNLYCDLSTRNELKPGVSATFYRGRIFGTEGPFVFKNEISDPPFLLLHNIEDTVGSQSGKCILESGTKIVEDLAGCCSHHGGISECVFGRLVCNDLTHSRTCKCNAFGRIELGSP